MRRKIKSCDLSAVFSAACAIVVLTLSMSVQAQSGTSGTDLLMRGLGEVSQGMSEMAECKNKFKSDPNGYWNCYQGVNNRSNQRNLQWQMELQEDMEKENQKRQEDSAREMCADREDDRAWALCMKRYGGR